MARKTPSTALALGTIQPTAAITLSKDQVNELLVHQAQQQSQQNMVDVAIAKARRALNASIKEESTELARLTAIQTTFVDSTNDTNHTLSLATAENTLVSRAALLTSALEGVGTLHRFVVSQAELGRYGEDRHPLTSKFNITTTLDIDRAKNAPENLRFSDFNITQTDTYTVPSASYKKALTTYDANQALIMASNERLLERKTQLANLFSQQAELTEQLRENALLTGDTDTASSFLALTQSLFTSLGLPTTTPEA